MRWPFLGSPATRLRRSRRIYRGAFDCLSSRDEAGGLSCASIHAYCHPEDRSSKLVVLILWDGYSGPLGFRSIQARALRIGRLGLYQALNQLHADLGGRGTLLVLGHSLGGAMVASAIQQGLATGRMPMDGAILVVGAFDTGMLGGLEPAPPGTGRGLFLLNLDMEGLIRSHVDIEDERAVRLYNRAAADLLFQVLWTRSHQPGPQGG